jgi:hypothetical protein
VDRPEITGTEILEKVKKTPAPFKLYEHRRHHQRSSFNPKRLFTCTLITSSDLRPCPKTPPKVSAQQR